MADHQESPRGTSSSPSKFRLVLSGLALSLSVFAVSLGVASIVFPLKAGSADTVATRVQNATNHISEALQAVPVYPKLKDRLNVLVMGVDWNGNKESERYQGNRSDTMMLVSLDPDHDKVGIISIPRDSQVTIGRHTSKINQAHANGGPELAVSTVRDNFGVPVDHYVVVDTVGLKDLFKLLGPVEVCVEKEMHYEDKTSGLKIDLKPGKQMLDAEQAEGYVRFRKDAYADIGRMERQQWFLRQSLSKLKDPAVLLKAPQLLEAGYKCVKTDLPATTIAEILSFAKDLKGGSIVTATLPGQGETIDGVNYFILSQKGTHSIFERFGLVAPDAPRSRRVDRIAHDEDTLREKTRITIRFKESIAERADSIAEQLKERGWKVRLIETRLDNDCQHAQLDLHSRRATAEVIDLIKNDLPAVAEWPVVMKYDGCGSDISVVLPAPNKVGMEGATAAVPPESDAIDTQVQ
ncbi:MAG: LCP family protein [Candidatus Melainabacteria bacterium]|nr:LCP family protein [Candidatus Melainabacteria bacterium]